MEHLRREPLTPRPQVNFYNVPGAPKAEEGKGQGGRADKLPGFYMPQGGEDEEDGGESVDGDEVEDEESDEPTEVSGGLVVHICTRLFSGILISLSFFRPPFFPFYLHDWSLGERKSGGLRILPVLEGPSS